jgi:hypothetical protein
MQNPTTRISKIAGKKTLSHLFVCLLIVNLVLTGCGDALFDNPEPTPKPEPKPTLPAVTTSGKNTFGCRVNDTIWVSKGSFGISGTTLYYFQEEVTIRGYNHTKKEYVSLSLKPVTATGYYELSKLISSSTSRATYIPQSSSIYVAQPATEGYLNVLRFDTIKGIVSGTFAFNAYNQNGDTVHVTDGRFDLQF